MLLRKSYNANNVKRIGKKKKNSTTYFSVWLGFQDMTIMFLSQCNYSCFHSLPIPIYQHFKVLLNNRKKITPSSLLFSIISFGNFWTVLSPVSRGYHWSRFPSLLEAVVVWLPHWARGRFRKQTQVCSMADKFCFCPYSSCFERTVCWLFTPLKSKDTFYAVVLLSVMKRHRFLPYSR